MKWMKSIALALALLAGPAVAHEGIPEQVLDYYDTSVWNVVSSNGYGGSAFNVSPTFLVTNKHVADIMVDGRGMMTRGAASYWRYVEVVAVSDTNDLALLYCWSCASLDTTLLTIEDHFFEIGEVTYGGGYGYGTLGIHEGYTQSFDYDFYMPVTDTIAHPGDSGSPQIVVEDDGSLRLVGVRTMGLDRYLLLESAGSVAGFLRGLELL